MSNAQNQTGRQFVRISRPQRSSIRHVGVWNMPNSGKVRQ